MSIHLLIWAVMAVTVLLPALALVLGFASYFRLHRAVKHAGRRMGVHWWEAVGPVALVVGVFAVAAVVGDIPEEGEPGGLPFGFAGTVLLLGSVGAIVSIGWFREHRRLSARGDAVGTATEGPVAVTGTAVRHRDAVSSALSDEPALARSLRVTEHRGIGHRNVPVERHYEQEAVPFLVDDGTGTVLVEPNDDAALLWHDDLFGAGERLRGRGEERPPELDAVAQRTGVEPDEDTVFTEVRLPPESEVTVLGTLERDPERRYAVVRGSDERLVVLEGAPDEVRRSVARRVRYGAVIGVAGLATGTAGVFATTGVL